MANRRIFLGTGALATAALALQGFAKRTDETVELNKNSKIRKPIVLSNVAVWY